MPLLRRLTLSAAFCILLADVTPVYAEAGKGLGNTNWGALFLSFALIIVGTPFLIGVVVFNILDFVGRAASLHRGKPKRCVAFAYLAWPFSLIICMTVGEKADGFWQYVAIALLPIVAAAALGYYTKAKQS